MYLYNLNFYQNQNLIISCFIQCDADNAKQAMRQFKARLKTRADYIDALQEIKEEYPGFTMKAEKSIHN
jgi:hypothetical protein